MEYPEFNGVSCSRCGWVSLRQFQSCENRKTDGCPYALKETTPCPSRFGGSFMALMGLFLMFGFGCLPFLISVQKSSLPHNLIIGFLMLTFAFTICNVFVLLGIAFAGLRRSLFYNKSQSRFAELFAVFGFPLALRQISLGETISFTGNTSSIPLSLAGFLMKNSESILPSNEVESPPELLPGVQQKLKDLNADLDRSIALSVLGAIMHLAAEGCIIFRSARQEVYSKWYRTFPIETFYIFAGEGEAKNLGMLESDLHKKILNWQSQKWSVNDMVGPTFDDLLSTFRDTDSDFSAYQIRKLILAEAESRNGFKKVTGKGFFGKLMPTIQPAAETVNELMEAQRKLVELAHQLFYEQRKLWKSLLLAFKKTIFREAGKVPDPLQQQNSELRKKMLLYVAGASSALALIVSGIAAFI